MLALGLRLPTAASLHAHTTSSKKSQIRRAGTAPQTQTQSTQTWTHEAPVMKTGNLSNGIKVVTVKTQTGGVSVGLYVRSGTRFENWHSAGASFFLKRLAFSNSQFMHDLRVTRELELMGGNFSVGVGREQIVYNVNVPPSKVYEVLGIIRSVSEPRLMDFEIKDARPLAEEDLESASRDPQALLFDLLHQAAYRGTGLGRTLFAPYNMSHLDFQQLYDFRYGTYIPEQTALVAVGPGIDHDKLIQSANEAFQKQAVLPKLPPRIQDTPSTYVGGESIFANSADTHVALGFEGASFLDKDVFAYRALQHYLGGGKANFTKGGVGNGSAGSLYRNLVEKKDSRVSEAGAFSFNYSDSGLVGVYGVAPKGGSNARQLITALAQEITSLSNSKVDSKGLERAKNQFKSSVLFNTDTTQSFTDFLGNSSLLTKTITEVKSPSQWAEGINSVTAEDIQRVAKKMLSKPVSVAAIGDTAGVPHSSTIFSSSK